MASTSLTHSPPFCRLPASVPCNPSGRSLETLRAPVSVTLRAESRAGVTRCASRLVCMAGAVEERLGIKIERNPSEARLSELGIRSWPTWGCEVSEFPWTYSGTETCYLIRGKVKVTPAGETDSVEFGAGDLVIFPDGMSCTWKVSEAVHKHYRFD